jgi:hypothetical protein
MTIGGRLEPLEYLLRQRDYIDLAPFQKDQPFSAVSSKTS